MGFFILFPTFLTYQALVQFGYITPIFGGYFTFGAALCLPFVAYSFLGLKKKRPLFNSYVIGGYILFIFLLALVSVVGHINLANSEVITTNLAVVLRSIAIFFVIICFDSTRKYNGLFIRWFFVIYSLVALISSIDGSFVIRGLEIDGSLFQVDYQTTAIVYLLFLIYAAPTLGLGSRLLLYALAMPTLFYIGARSELLGFIPLIFVMEFLLARSLIIYWLNMLLFGLAVVAVGIVLYSEYSDSRIFNLLSLNSDASSVARSEFTARALRTIADNPFFGGFASYPPGEYSHNLLSVWVDFGIFGFLFVLILFVMQGAFLIWRCRARDPSIEFVRASVTFSMMMIMVATAKNYGYPMIPIAMAFYALHRREIVLSRRRFEAQRVLVNNVQ